MPKWSTISRGGQRKRRGLRVEGWIDGFEEMLKVELLRLLPLSFASFLRSFSFSLSFSAFAGGEEPLPPFLRRWGGPQERSEVKALGEAAEESNGLNASQNSIHSFHSPLPTHPSKHKAWGAFHVQGGVSVCITSTTPCSRSFLISPLFSPEYSPMCLRPAPNNRCVVQGHEA